MPEANPQRRLVRASAGTGKTYALTTRYLALLRAGVDPSTILATTFTRKAAGEIFQRVLTRLAGAVLDDDQRTRLEAALRDDGLLYADAQRLSSVDCADMLTRLVDRLDRTAIGTLDGFFARLCGVFALDLGLPVDPTLTDDGSALAAELRESAIQAMLGQAADEGFAALLTLLRQLHHDTTKRSVTASLDGIFRGDADGLYTTFRQARASDTWPTLDPPGTLDDENLHRLAVQLAESKPQLPTTKAGRAHASWAKALGTALGHLHTHRWGALLGGGLVKAALADGTYYGQAMSPELRVLCEQAGRHALARLIETLNLQHRSAWRLLDHFADHFEHRCAEQHVLLFADLTDRLARHLRLLNPDSAHPTDPAVLRWRNELTYRIDGRIEHLLIDEFQDTSVDQFAVLHPIIDEITVDASSSRTLFVVGDAKQSIYGWRGGRVELFDTLVRQLEPAGLDQRVLDRSFRSSDGVLHPVNAVFGPLLETPAWEAHAQAKQRFAEDFRPHAAADPELPGEFRLITTPTSTTDDASTSTQDGDPDPSSAHAHEHGTAQHLQQLAERWPAASFGALVRTNAQANALLQACRRLGLPASGETGAALTDHPAVNAVLAAMTLADHPGDAIAAFHVAHTPLGPVLKLESDRPGNAQRVSRRIREELAARGYAAVVARWVAALAPACDAAGLRRLRQLVGLAERYRPAAILRPDAFVRFVRASRVEDPSTGRVRIMTVHRAKGLEFDAVVLPYLHDDQRFRPVLLEQRDGDTGPVTAVYRAGKRELREHLPELQALYAQAESRHAYEQLCTLYVALTRAKHATHVLTPPASHRDPRKSDSMLALLLHALVPDDRNLRSPQTTAYAHEHRGGADPYLSAKRPQQSGDPAPDTQARVWPARSQAKPDHPSSLAPSRPLEPEAPQSLAEQILGSPHPAERTAMLGGTRIHQAFRSIRFTDEDDRVIPETTPPDIADHVRHALAQPPIRDALARRGAQDLRRELPLSRLDDQGRIVHGVIDRLVWWSNTNGQALRAEVQDFKSDAPAADRDDDAGLTDWLEDRRARHEAQLEHYRHAAAAWLDLAPAQVEAALLFTSVGRVVRW
ncbi:MAG: UvrD-helicase domain-containing protein [Planctomycetota bacterium]